MKKMTNKWGGGGYNSTIIPQNSEVNRSNLQDTRSFEQNVDFLKNVKISKNTGHLEQPDFCNSKLVKLVNKSKKNKLLYVGLFCLMILLYVGILCAVTTFQSTQLNTSVQADELAIGSGFCGDGGINGENVKYTFDNTGLLTISLADGYTTGAIKDYYYMGSPFYRKDNIKRVVINSGITRIGNETFDWCSQLDNITISESVVSIGLNAFSGTKFYTDWGTTDLALYIGNFLIDVRGSVENFSFSVNTRGIADYAFSACTSLTSITIPNTITSISCSAFSGCSGLTTITIPDSVISIGDSAFSGCSGLTSVTFSINSKLKSIGDSAFGGCTSLTNITIPASVTNMGENPFGGCSGLTSIKVDKGNKNFTSQDNAGKECNVIIKKDTNTLISGCQSSNIPNSVTSIDEYAFADCSELTSITIPEGVTNIGSCAFSGCGLTSITIPEGVTSIGNQAFSSCSGLKCVKILNNNTSIGDRAFEGCSNLTIFDAGYANSNVNIDSKVYQYAQSNKIKYGYNMDMNYSDTQHSYSYIIDFENGSTTNTKVEDHTFVDVTCNVCGARKAYMVTLNVTIFTGREFVIYILDKSDRPSTQFVVGKSENIVFTVAKDEKFTIHVYETLYMRAKIDSDYCLKKEYTANQDHTIPIEITGVMNVNNWISI